MKPVKIDVKIPGRAYPVYIGRNLSVPKHLNALLKTDRAVIVTDRNLRSGLAAKIAASLKKSGVSADLYALPCGEIAKSLKELERLYAFLLRKKVERRTPLIAVGGGTVGDAAGFAAATYFRGLPLIHIPTTLLAQVDSAIGGKTAVNHPLAKNAVGTFYHPRAVLADVDALKSLPKAEFHAGMAEVVKYALVFDPAFARFLESSWRRIAAGDSSTRIKMVAACVRWKAKIVAEDELDLSGRRELLNFGHTLGHALESATGFSRYRHGEAVAWGMRAAAALSVFRGGLRRTDGALSSRLLNRLPALRRPANVTDKRLFAALKADKKVTGGRNVFILLDKIGRPRRVTDVLKEEISAAVEEIG